MNSKLSNQITMANGSGCLGSAIRENGGRMMLTCSYPYLARQLSVFGPGKALGRRVNLCHVLPNPDGDARRIHRGLSWFGQRRPYVQRGRKVLYFLAPKCLRRGYKL
jgi:hypothetical protein